MKIAADTMAGMASVGIFFLCDKYCTLT